MQILKFLICKNVPNRFYIYRIAVRYSTVKYGFNFSNKSPEIALTFFKSSTVENVP